MKNRSHGGTLRLDQSTTFAGSVSGFGLPDHLDLRDITFGAKTTVGFSEASNDLSGTLTVSDGTHAANIQLHGSTSPASSRPRPTTAAVG